MRMSSLFGRTLRQAPVEADVESHRLLARAGYIRQVGSGLYSYLPLGWRVLRKIEAIIRDEMDRIGGQEILMPVVNPADLWKESGRWHSIGPELVRFEDRAGRELVLAMTHEEVVTDLVRREVRSYRHLPTMLYQIQTKVRDEARPRGGLLRVREFVMKDAYSFHPDQDDLDAYYPQVYQAYVNIFRRCGVAALPVEADPGLIGGTGSHEFVMLTPVGEDTIIRCTGCAYSANAEKAVSLKSLPESPSAAAVEPLELVRTPGTKSIEALAAFFALPPQAFLKTVFYSTGGEVVAAAIRGDLEVNEAKLSRHLGRADLRLATDDELAAVGVVPGYASPVAVAGGPTGLRVVVDDSVPGRVFIAGGNQLDYHLRNVLYGRDFTAEAVADIALAGPGQHCADCGAELAAERGIELGHTFKLGTKYSAAMHAEYRDVDGQQKPIYMGCYGIGPGRLLAAVVEQHHDEQGIVWPAALAPYHVYLCALGMDSPDVAAAAARLAAELERAGVEVLFDDRAEAPGVKFTDADLIGLPFRVVVSQRTVKADGAEVRRRTAPRHEFVRLEEVVGHVKAGLEEMSADG